MKLVKMIRSSPEIPGGPTSCKVQLQDVAALEARGYVQDGEPFEFGEAVVDKKPALIAKAIELELGTEDELNALSEDELAALLADSSKDNTNTDKAELVAKALALKETNPKQVKVPPSAIPNMSVEKLIKLIADAEAAIASGNQE